jgi:hypothetical protein
VRPVTPFPLTAVQARACEELRGHMAEKTDISPEEGARAAEALLDFYKKGRASLRRLESLRRRDPAALRHGRKQETLEAEARHAGLNHDLMKKAWRLTQQYTEEEILAICGKVRERPARFGYSHLVKALGITDRGLRQHLVNEAIGGQWSVAALQRAIQTSKERRPDVGRKPKTPDDVMEALLVLQTLCLKFNRWCDVAFGMLPEEVQDATRKAHGAVERAGEAAAKHIRQYRRDRQHD